MHAVVKSLLPVAIGLGGVGIGVLLARQHEPPEPVEASVVVTTDFSSGEGAAAEDLTTDRDWKTWDVDGDGRIDADEFQARRTDDAFAKRDRNGDGFLTRDDRDRRGGGQAERRRRGRGRPSTVELVDRADEALATSELDHLTATTFPGPRRVFDRLDEDGDGELTQDELDGFEPRERSLDTGDTG